MEIKTVYGVGYSSDKTLPSKNRSVYKKWAEILRRCYLATQNSYKDCLVCPLWHDFKNFLDWYKTNCPDESYHLDKDILFKGNKVYSPETCCFIPKAINSILINCGNSEVRDLPLGVSASSKSFGKYEARVSYKGKTKYSKTFSTVQEAESFYIDKKREILELYISEYEVCLSPEVVEALRLSI
jgi:hypothetical protein